MYLCVLVAAGVQYVTQHLGQSLQLLKLKKILGLRAEQNQQIIIIVDLFYIYKCC